MDLHTSTSPYTVRSKDKPYQAPLGTLIHITHRPAQQHHFSSAIMADYMTLHASAYPPASWTFLTYRQSKPSRTSNNELWTEMTSQYELSMAKRKLIFTSNYLSKTATEENVHKMRSDALRLHRQRIAIAFEDAADVVDILQTRHRFVKNVDELAKNPMKTIPEEDESGATHSRRQPTEKELHEIKEAILRTKKYESLQGTDKIERTFRTRLMEIYSAYHTFICTPVGKHPRPRWTQICRMDNEVTTHVARVAHAQQQLTSDVSQLRKFLREQLFDQYCLMRVTPMEEKDETWLQYGKCLLSGHEIGKGNKIIDEEDC